MNCVENIRRKTKNRRAQMQIQNMETLIGENFINLVLIISCTILDTNKYFSLSGSLSGFNFISVLPYQPGFSSVNLNLGPPIQPLGTWVPLSNPPITHPGTKKMYFWYQTILQRSRIRSSWIWQFRIMNLIVFLRAEVTDLPLLPWLVTGQ